jgi:hypothetical protein
MRAVTKPIVLAVAGVLGLGLVTAAAADSHGVAVSALAKSKTLTGSAHGKAVSALATTNGSGTNGSSTNGGGAKAKDAHGDLVSAAAMGSAKAAHTTGAMKTNHGGAVILVSRKPNTR